MKTTNRQISLDLLRIMAMFMIVILHVQGKTEWLRAVPIGQGDWVLRWGLEALAIVAVNCYVLISGYFLVKTQFTIHKVLVLWGRVLFWSILLGIAGWMAGGYPLSGAHALATFLPITMREYWFASVYIGFYLLSPFLQFGLQAMSRKMHLSLVMVLLVICSVWQTLLPFSNGNSTFNPLDGKNILWFITLYCTAAYLRLYRDDLKIKCRWSIPIYFLTIGGMLLIQYLSMLLEKRFGFGGWIGEISYAYASVPCFVASVALFCFFVHWEGKASQRMQRFVTNISACTFGIYLIHEHPAVQSFLWNWVTHLYEGAQVKPSYVPVVLLISLCIFSSCALLEYLRIKAFSGLEEAGASWKAAKRLERVLYPFLQQDSEKEEQA
jgi:surface polysaccharide O-acyltransferase-like enzyme